MPRVAVRAVISPWLSMVTINAWAGYALRDVFLESAFTAEDLRVGMTWRTIEPSRHPRLRHRRGRFEIAPPPLCARLMRGRSCRVGEDVAILTPHRPGRADFPHPVLHERDSLAAA